MDYEPIFQTASRVLGGRPAIKFDPKNPEHRKAAAEFELTGKWTLRFLTEWPYVTVPQTILAAVLRDALNDEFVIVANEKKLDLKPGFESYFVR